MDPEELLTAGQLARLIQRSTYGVKKALERRGHKPRQILNGISYYDPALREVLLKEMRGPNLIREVAP